MRSSDSTEKDDARRQLERDIKRYLEVGGKIKVLRGQTFSDTVDPEWGRQSEFRNRMGENGTKK
tara:strand:+ start:723 stop:914 length:192 start_codon:yes stop_codon:yes gene_type:complete